MSSGPHDDDDVLFINFSSAEEKLKYDSPTLLLHSTALTNQSEILADQNKISSDIKYESFQDKIMINEALLFIK